MIPTVENEPALLALLRSGDPYTTEQYVTAGKVATFYYRDGEDEACASITREAPGIGRFVSLGAIADVRIGQAQSGDKSAQKEIQAIGQELRQIAGA